MSLVFSRRTLFFRKEAILLALVLAIGFLLRLLAIGQYITPDELNWVHRSVLFHQALSRGDWAGTLTTGHPGVLTTWLGALGIQTQLWLRPFDAAAYDWITNLAWLAPENTAAFPQLATFLSAGRLAVAGVNSLGLLAAFWLARRLVGIWPAIVATGLLALDPFVAGLSGLLHVDGLMTTFTTVSLLALALAFEDAENYNWPLMALSGVGAGCAMLTKSAALTLLPFAGLAFSFGLIVQPERRQKIVLQGLLWLAATVAIQFLVLPALWTNPVGSYQTIIGTTFHEAEEVLPATFFMGNVSQSHGLLFYPVALLFRLNPLIFIGLLLLMFWSWQDRPRHWRPRPFLLLAIGWPIFFIFLLSIATKKYDRYLLPALPMLFFLGALGWRQLLLKRPSWSRQVIAVGAFVAVAYVGTAGSFLLNRYNPLVGGTVAARYVMPLGWGESVSAAAKWLAEQPDVTEKTAVVGIGPAFAPYFPGKTILRDGDNWRSAHYLIETVAGYQEASLVPQLNRPGLILLHTLRYGGLDQAWIFRVEDPQEPQITWQPQDRQFGGQVNLLAAGTAVDRRTVDVWAQWQLLQAVNGRFNVQIRLLDEYGQLWSQVEMPLLNDVYFYPENWRPGEQPVWRYSLDLPPGLPPARYALEMALFTAEDGAQLPVMEKSGRFAGVVHTVSQIWLAPPPLFQIESRLPTTAPTPLLDGALLFVEQGTLPENVMTAGSFTVEMYWQGVAELSENLQLQFWVDEWLLTTLPLSRFPTGSWQPGQVIREKYPVPIPVDMAAGDYALEAKIVDSSGRYLSSPFSLGTIAVRSPDRLFALPSDVGQPVLLHFSDLMSLRGYDLQTTTAVPGSPVQLTLYWQTARQTEEIFSTFVHLVGPDGQIVEQGDQWPGGLPSNAWAAGQVIVDQYAIELPEDAPLGTYQIVLGLYAPANGLRLPIVSEAGSALPGDQFVLPDLLEVVR